MDLDIDVSKLKLLKANHLSQKYALEDKIYNSYSFDDKKFLPLLPIHRLEKYQKFRFEKDRKNCLGVYILLKNHFSNHGKKMPELFIGENGKPYFPQGNIYFSFSHTDTAFACAVCENEIGLDIQSFETPSDRIIKKICTPKEAEKILGSDNKDREFTALWTLKESALKKTRVLFPTYRNMYLIFTLMILRKTVNGL